MGKFSICFHITEKQNDWDEIVAMWESNPITSRFKYPVLVRSHHHQTQFYFAKCYLEKLYFILMMNFRIALFAVPWFSVSSEGRYPSKWLFTSEQEQGTEVSLSSTGKTCHLIPVRSIISFETSQDALVQSPLSTAVFWRSGMRALVRQLLSFSGKY